MDVKDILSIHDAFSFCNSLQFNFFRKTHQSGHHDCITVCWLKYRSYRRNFESIVNKLKVLLLILIEKVNRRLHFAIAEIIKAYKLEAKKF